jgi:oxygen-dependent protoporphyrinogen oxidase
MALDLFLPAGGGDDESIGAFVRRRLGRECYERLAQPLVSAIYGGDPDRLSLRSTLPRFADMERRHGSVIRGLRAAEKRRSEEESGARYGLFVTFEEGMQTLVDALAARIGDARIRRGAEAKALRHRVPPDAPSDARWEVILGSGERLVADAAIVALPVAQATNVLREIDDALARAVAGIPTLSSAIVTLAWRREDVPHALDAFGLVVPRLEGRRILAASFSSVKFPGRAPEGATLVRAFVGGGGRPDPAEATDAAILEAVREELGELVGARAAPFFEAVHRHPQGTPQFEIGHDARVAAIREAVSRHPGLALAGNYFTGVGVPDAVRSGEAAAEAVIQFLVDPASAEEGAKR